MSEWPAQNLNPKSVRPKSWRERLRHCPVRWCFTNGCFDMLSIGPWAYLAQARSAGAALVVALNTDASGAPSGAKGDDRPINLWKTARQWQRHWRAWIWSWFDDDTPAALIEMVKP